MRKIFLLIIWTILMIAAEYIDEESFTETLPDREESELDGERNRTL